MNIKLPILAVLLLLVITRCLAQDNLTTGIIPTVNLNVENKKDLSFNLKLETRNKFDNGIDPDLAEISFLSGKKVGLNNKLSVGYSYLIQDEKDAHRFIQQFSIVKRFDRFRMAYRLASDQTIIDRNVAFRFRAKVTAEIPFNGISVDSGEFYLKAYNEYLNKFIQKDYELEFRLSPLLGYKISEKNKLEIGIDHRIKSFLQENSEYNLWLKLNWYIKI